MLKATHFFRFEILKMLRINPRGTLVSLNFQENVFLQFKTNHSSQVLHAYMLMKIHGMKFLER